MNNCCYNLAEISRINGLGSVSHSFPSGMAVSMRTRASLTSSFRVTLTSWTFGELCCFLHTVIISCLLKHSSLLCLFFVADSFAALGTERPGHCAVSRRCQRARCTWWRLAVGGCWCSPGWKTGEKMLMEPPSTSPPPPTSFSPVLSSG